MSSTMQVADLKLVDASHPNAQRVAILKESYAIDLAHAAVPVPAPDEVRIKITFVGICGSDVETYRGQRSPEFVSVPARLGHEVSGIIDMVGDQVHGLSVGDKVACRYVWGAFAEYIVCKPFNVKVLPATFPMEEISTLEVLPGILHAAELGNIGTSTSVLIMGQGVSGLIMTQVAALYSPKHLVVTDLHQRNLDLAKKYGATHTYQIPTPDTPTADVLGDDFPDGFDVVIPCLLEGDGMVDALHNVAFGGRIVMYGCIGTCEKPFDFFRLHRKRADIYSTEPKRDIDMRRFFQEGYQLLVDGLLNTKEMITDVYSLDDIAEAFRVRSAANDNDSLHILIDCEKK